MSMSKEEISILVENISALAEINVYENLKMFIKAMEDKKIPQEQRLNYFKFWLDMSINACNERVKGGQQ